MSYAPKQPRPIRILDIMSSLLVFSASWAFSRGFISVDQTNVGCYPARSCSFAALLPAFLGHCQLQRLPLSDDRGRNFIRYYEKNMRPLCCRRRGGIVNQAGKDGWEGKRRRKRVRRSLLNLSQAINNALLEMCVENKGRPLAMAMTDFVERTVETFMSGE